MRIAATFAWAATWLCLSASAAAAAAITAPAATAPVQTASFQGVQATLTTEPNQLADQARVPTHLTIVDHGQTSFSGPLGVPCHFCELSPPGSGPLAIQVRDLDRSGGPQVLVYLDDSGNDFYTTLVIYHQGGDGEYHPVVLRSVYILGTDTVSTRVRRIGAQPLLFSDDLRFLAFADGGEDYAALPLVLWSYRRGTLTDVAARHPDLLRRDAARAWRDARAFEQARVSGTGDNGPDPRGALATYADDEVRLGHRQTAERALRMALAQGWLNEPEPPHGIGYIRALNRLLGKLDKQPART